MHINIEALHGIGIRDIIYGVNTPNSQYVPGLAHRLMEYYGSTETMVVLDDPNKVDDEFISFHTAMLRHVSMTDLTKNMFIMAGRSHVYDRWFPRNRDKIVITTNVLFGGAVGSRNTFPPVRMPNGNGFQQLPPMVTAYAMYRYVTDNCFPDLVLSYEPSIEAIQAAVKEPIEKIQLAANAYAYMRAAYLDEVAEKKAKSELVPLAPTTPTLPPVADVIQAMFDVVVRVRPKRR
jgi:hypothetical protein